jgi:hypothetical protein
MGIRDLFRWDPRARRGALLAKATLSPAGVVTGGALAVAGLAAGIALPWVIGAGVAAWLTSAVLHLRDPKLVSSLLAPQFDRDLSVLDAEHLRYMTAALRARDRFEASLRDLPDRDDFGGMRTRVTEALRRLYDSVVWSQRAATFLRSVDEQQLRNRLASLPSSSQVAEELAEQLEEVESIESRRNETLTRISATITGIETLGVKMASFALGSTAPGGLASHSEEVRRLRCDLDTYVDALAEVEESLHRELPPEPL